MAKTTVTKKYATSRQPSIQAKWGRKLTLLLLIILLAIWGLEKLYQPATFPIRKVTIIAPGQHISHTALQQTITPYLAQGMLWLKAPDLQQALLKIPWIAAVQLKRQWPDQLLVIVTQQIPIAHWNGQDLLNNQQQIFDPANSPTQQTLPWLRGQPQQAAMLWQGYVQLNQMLVPLHLWITHLTLNNQQNWQLELNNSLKIILGNDHVPQRLQHFVQLYPQLFAHPVESVQYIDLRYNNGFAVKWLNSVPVAE